GSIDYTDAPGHGVGYIKLRLIRTVHDNVAAFRIRVPLGQNLTRGGVKLEHGLWRFRSHPDELSVMAHSHAVRSRMGAEIERGLHLAVHEVDDRDGIARLVMSRVSRWIDAIAAEVGDVCRPA